MFRSIGKLFGAGKAKKAARAEGLKEALEPLQGLVDKAKKTAEPVNAWIHDPKISSRVKKNKKNKAFHDTEVSKLSDIKKSFTEATTTLGSQFSKARPHSNRGLLNIGGMSATGAAIGVGGSMSEDSSFMKGAALGALAGAGASFGARSFRGPSKKGINKEGLKQLTELKNQMSSIKIDPLGP